MVIGTGPDARSDWAQEQGLEPADGPYLVELAFRPLTLQQLGEALAIHSQTREMIGVAVERLVLQGFLRVAAVEAEPERPRES